MSDRWVGAGARKAVRDFWQERTRTALVVLAIALGIAAFSTVMSTYAVLVRELDHGYLATNPASAILRTDAVDDKLIAAVLSNHDVAEAEARRSLTGRIQAGPAEWRNLSLFVVKDYGDIRISKLVPQEGAWPPGPGEILIERDAFQVARARIGDPVTVKTVNGTERTLRISGSVHDVGQAQARMENLVYGYVTLDTLAQLGEQPYLDQLTLVVAGDKFDEARVRRVAEDVKKQVESAGHPVRRMDVPKPGKHPHADLMGLLLLAQAGFGLFALFLSGILVVNLLTALMASQLRQIGVMKAVGGSRGQIARIYLGQAAFLGIAATAIAVPAGMWGSRVFCRYMAVFLNFDITSFAVPLWVYALDALVGIVVPLLAAAGPVARGSRIPVREALADTGVATGAFGTGALDRALLGMRGMGRPLLLSIRNSFRRRTRLALTVATLTAGGLFFLSALNVRASLVETLDRLFDSMRYDLTVSFAQLYPLETVERAVRQTPGVARAEGWITVEATVAGATDVPGGAAASPGSPTEPVSAGGPHGAGAPAGDHFTLVVLPAGSGMLKPIVVEGRGLQPGDTNALVVNSRLAANDRRMGVGREVTLRMGHRVATWRVVGRSREPFSPPVAYVSLGYWEELTGQKGMLSSLRLVLDKTDAASISAVRASLDRNLDREGVRAVASATTAERRYAFDQHMLMIYVFLIVMSAILAGVGGLGLMTTMSLNVLERRREMGVLRAIGATPRAVWLIVVTEGMVVGVLSWAFAALLAWPVGRAVGEIVVLHLFRTALNFVFLPAGLLVWLGVSVVLSAVASFLPAWHASRRPIREAIGYE